MLSLQMTLSKNQFYMKKKSNASIMSCYELKQTIGEGGFAKVKRATHKLTGQDVAVKIIKKGHLQSQEIKRQTNIHKILFHQNIVKAYQIVQDNKKSIIIMEYIKNRELFEKIKQEGQLQESLAGKIFCQIHSALKYLHNQKIMHRDVKIQNIVLDQEMNAKLIDFGLAQQYQKNGQIFNLTGACGSIAYMPPQILNDQSYTGSSVDVWSLGVTLYAMLAGQLPFGSALNQITARNIRQLDFFIKPSFSFATQKLFFEIFQYKQQRITLEGIQKSEFYLKYCQKKRYNFINTKNEYVSIDTHVINQIERKYGISGQNIQASVKNLNYDNLYSLYYLTIEKNASEGKRSQSDLNSPNFKKCLKQKKQSDEKKFSLGIFLKSTMTKSSIFQTSKGNFRIRSNSQLKKYSQIKRINDNKSIHKKEIIKESDNIQVKLKNSILLNKHKLLKQIEEFPQVLKKQGLNIQRNFIA